MADPRRLREILGFGYGAPSPAMSALEPFHAGVDPQYMPQDVVTESPWEGPRGWVRSGLESLFGAIAPSERAASTMAEKVTNLSDFVNVPQEAFDIGKAAGDAIQGGDKLSLAMSMLPGKAADEIVPAVKAAQKGIRAYHGTPHDFDKFSLDKIGTGEGAQAYGHGLYFAENEAVAKDYRDTLADDYFETPEGKIWSPDSLEHLNLRVMMRKDGDVDAALARANDLLPKASDLTRDMLQGDIAALNRLKATGGLTKKTSGKMYEVNINADPEHFLDYDRPLMDQPHIRQALGMPESIAPWETLTNEQYNAAADQLGFHIPPHVDDLSKVTGEHFMEAKPRQGYGRPEDRMKAAGIPGIKYLDAGSRTGGEGSRNYVVFSDEIIDIVKKYGIAGALGAGLITQQMADQLEAQQGGGQS
jgi:hypothetical protein